MANRVHAEYHAKLDRRGNRDVKGKWNQSWLAPKLIALVLIAGCGSTGSSDTPTGPPATVFSSLSITPTEAVMCLIAPGNTVVLNATPFDQSGQAMGALGSPSFTSSDRATSVDANGLVRAIAADTAHITASLTAAGMTRTASAVITVAEAVAGNAWGSVLANHELPHIALVTGAQLSAGNALILDIQGRSQAGCRISQVSSADTHSDGFGLHSHTVIFN